MTWEIVVGIITLVGFIITIVTSISKLIRIMTELTMSVENLKEVINQMGANNAQTVKRIWQHNDEQDELLQEHEKRITKIEYDIDKFHSSH